MEGRNSGFNSRKNRNSILQSAGDALSGLRLNKRKRFSRPPTHAPSSSMMSADDMVVLEISASRNTDYDWTNIAEPIDEEAERERLRDAAAQAVGLSERHNVNGSITIADDSGRTKSSKSLQTSSGPPLPRYPSSASALQNYVQHSSNLLKYYPSPSPFLILARSRQWKTRYLILTTSDQPGGTESHLHLFKTSSPNDKELERLCIQHDSLVYVADEEVGGARHFILKVGGKVIDVNSAKKEDAPAATWLLQMADASQMDRWMQFVKNSIKLQSASPDLKSDFDVVLSPNRQTLLAPPKSNTAGNSGSSSPHSALQNNTDEKTTSLGPVSALKGFWNGRPISRNLSISGSSIATALASPSSHSQASAVVSLEHPDPVPADGSSAKTRESAIFQMFRPTSPHITPTSKNHISPPTSPTTASSLSEDGTIPASSPMGRRFPPSATGRPGHTHNSFSVDWEAIEGATLIGMGSNRMKSPTNETSLAPPPRRRPLTGSGRQGSPPKDSIDESKATPPPEMRRSVDDEGELSMISPADQEQHHFEHTDDSHDEGDLIIQEPSPGGHNMSPLSTHSYGHEQEDGASQLSAHVPSPMMHTPSLPPSSVSSFGANASIKTATHEQATGAGVSRSSTPSIHSESRGDQYIEEDRRSNGYDPDEINQFHLPTGARRRSRLSSLPKSPPLGPLPPPPVLHSPPFSPHSPTHDYSGSERPPSSSSVPSTVPSLPALVNKRISTMSTDAPSVKSNESSTGSMSNLSNSRSFIGSPFGNQRLAPPSGPRASAFPPPRPAPAVPLPPAPLDDMTTMGGNPRNSLSGRYEYNPPSGSTSPSSRSDFTSRSVRHSMGPAPPPTIPLPPRPDTIPMSYNHQRSSMSSTGHSHLQSLFTIPGSPDRQMSGFTLPAMAPPPVRPLPPTPHIPDAERPVSPTLSLNSNRSSRSMTALPSFKNMSSLKARLRMMSNPVPMTVDTRKAIPPPGPPPSHPPPAPPERQSSPTQWAHVPHHQKQQGSESTTGHSQHSQFSSYSPPITPLGGAISSRLDHYPFNVGLPSPPPSMANAAFSPFASMGLRQPPTGPTPLSPPPRRSSRASRDFTPQEKEKLRMLTTALEEDRSSPYDLSTVDKHSAINLPTM